RALQPGPGDTTVTLTTTPAFASQCLLPGLPELRRLHPDVELRLHAGDSPVDLALGGADLAVRYGDGPWPHDHEALPLAEDRLLPVASPALALRDPRDLVRHRLIHRSEEHTSELQSRENLVCRLLLEKKKHTDGPAW